MSEIRTGCNDNCPYYTNNTGCLKPDGLGCPPQSVTYEVAYDKQADLYHGVISKENAISAFARRCIICGKTISYDNHFDEVVCDECKEAIAWIKKKIISAYLNREPE